MPKSETYIQFIIEQLQKGNVVYKDVFLVFLSKFKCTEPTFVKYWKIAQERHTEAQQAINEQKTKEYTQNEIEAQKRLILDRNKVMEMSSNVLKIAFNNVVKQKDEKSINAYAIAQSSYSKLTGMDAPTKVANTDSEGKDKPSQTIELPNGASIELA